MSLSHRAFLLGVLSTLLGATMLVLSCVTVSAHPQTDPPNLFVMEMADAPGTIDQQKLRTGLQLSARELKVDERELPCILVFHVSKDSAARLNLTGSSSWHVTGPLIRYELWIVGEPSDYIYAGLAVNILKHQFGLTIEDNERNRIIQSVRSRIATTIYVEAARQKRK